MFRHRFSAEASVENLAERNQFHQFQTGNPVGLVLSSSACFLIGLLFGKNTGLSLLISTIFGRSQGIGGGDDEPASYDHRRTPNGR